MKINQTKLTNPVVYAPYLKEFEIDSHSFSNNFNLCLIFEIIFLFNLATITVILKYKSYKLKNLLYKPEEN